MKREVKKDKILYFDRVFFLRLSYNLIAFYGNIPMKVASVSILIERRREYNQNLT